MAKMGEFTVGFIGLGRMGQGMAASLLAQGTRLLVHDRTTEAMVRLVASGAVEAENVAALARASDVILTSLPGPAEVEAVAFGPDGLIEHMQPGTTHFDRSTSSRDLALRIAAACAAKNCSMLDAPVSGGPAGAASGDLVLWIGGDRAVFEQHRDLLARFSTPHYVGGIGSGTVTKLAHNTLGYALVSAQAEAFTLAVKAGLDPLDFWQALRFGIVGKQSPLFMLTQQFLPGEFDSPAFGQKLALKGVRLAAEMAAELGVLMPLSAAMRQDMEAVVARGEGEGDSRSFLKLQVERAGVTIRVPRDRIETAVKAARA